MEIVKSLEESGLLIKAGTETIENKAKEQKSGFLDILLGSSTAGVLGSMLAGRSNKSK